MGIQLMLLAALFVAGQNFFFRRSIDSGGTSKAYLMVQLFLTFFVMILLNPVRSGNYTWDVPMAVFGFCGGLLLAAFMAMMGKALESGPPGLTFAVVNASSVMPILLMVMLFGAFGFTYTKWNGIGSFLVVAGLFWAAKATMKEKKSLNWVVYALIAFALHTLFLAFLQWRSIFFTHPGQKALFLSFNEMQAATQWFMPMIFLAASLVQGYIFFTIEKRRPLPAELGYGVLGGVANGVGTFFMIWSTEAANSVEQAMIFPIFSVGVIVLSNLWAQRVYKEKVNWVANAFCVMGLIIGTLDWRALIK